VGRNQGAQKYIRIKNDAHRISRRSMVARPADSFLDNGAQFRLWRVAIV
jgi:hypothetical protein